MKIRPNMPWKKMLALVSGKIDPLLLHKLEYVLEENRVYRKLHDRLDRRLLLTDAERAALAEKGKPLGKLLADVITIVEPETLLKWHRTLVAKKWTFTKTPQPGRPPISAELTNLILKLARENRSWGYDRIVGVLKSLNHVVSHQTVANVLKANGLDPSDERKRKTTWKEFIQHHKDVLWATDFFAAEVWTAKGLTTFYILFFIQLQTRRVILGGITPNPTDSWVQQVARNITGPDSAMAGAKYLIHDRDGKYSPGFDRIFKSVGIKPVLLPPSSPNLNAYAERWVRSVKCECLDEMILFGEKSLNHVLDEYVAHYHEERPHQGIDNVIPFPCREAAHKSGRVKKRERLGGLLNFYHRAAA